MLLTGKHAIWVNFRDDGNGGGEKLTKQRKKESEKGGMRVPYFKEAFEKLKLQKKLKLW